jgi:hypothetical protein
MPSRRAVLTRSTVTENKGGRHSGPAQVYPKTELEGVGWAEDHVRGLAKDGREGRPGWRGKVKVRAGDYDNILGEQSDGPQKGWQKRSPQALPTEESSGEDSEEKAKRKWKRKKEAPGEAIRPVPF